VEVVDTQVFVFGRRRGREDRHDGVANRCECRAVPFECAAVEERDFLVRDVKSGEVVG
jgi:hypothetical protein